MGKALHILAYTWGTVVLASMAQDFQSDHDFWAVAALAMVGSMVLVGMSKLHWFNSHYFAAGLVVDTYSGYILPQHNDDGARPDRIAGVFLGMATYTLCFAEIGISLWRTVLLASDTALKPRVKVSLLLYYALLMLAALIWLVVSLVRMCCLCSLDKTDLVESVGDGDLQVRVQGQALLVKVPVGLTKRIMRYYHEHVHDLTVQGGIAKGAAYATPVGYLLCEYHYSRKQNLRPLCNNLNTNTFYLLEAFKIHGTEAEKYVIRQWAEGKQLDPVMLVEQQNRPGHPGAFPA
jgi:hypothetical protein